MSKTESMKAAGYRCRWETIPVSQGYVGGGGVSCYRVRDHNNVLAMYRVSTFQCARLAWREAAEFTQRYKYDKDLQKWDTSPDSAHDHAYRASRGVNTLAV